MDLYLYNSRTRKKEKFKPLNSQKVGMYVCGPTVYDYAHIGNARPVVVFDVLYRILKKKYDNVCYVRNVTDIDDKIIQASQEKKISIFDLTTQTLNFFHEDMMALNALKPDYEPKATEHISSMIELVEKLLHKGFAYYAQGHVLFDVARYSDYGCLSLKKQEDLLSGVRVEHGDYKKNAADFVLWKPSLNDEPGWDSPWGYGRPGWHLECSAMSHEYLGDVFDIHGGGIDLIFPHHENEIAQSCCGYETNIMAHVWMHNGHLLVNGEKMSKSLGNFKTVRELRSDYHPEIIRYALLSAHYRQPLDFSDQLLNDTQNNMNKFYRIFDQHEHVQSMISEDVLEALYDDLNTPKVFSILHGYLHAFHKENDLRYLAYIKGAGEILGLFYESYENWFQKQNHSTLSEDTIKKLIDERIQARQNKDFKKSDAIRDELKSYGVILDDGPAGTKWRYDI